MITARKTFTDDHSHSYYLDMNGRFGRLSGYSQNKINTKFFSRFVSGNCHSLYSGCFAYDPSITAGSFFINNKAFNIFKHIDYGYVVANNYLCFGMLEGIYL